MDPPPLLMVETAGMCLISVWGTRKLDGCIWASWWFEGDLFEIYERRTSGPDHVVCTKVSTLQLYSHQT